MWYIILYYIYDMREWRAEDEIFKASDIGYI